MTMKRTVLLFAGLGLTSPALAAESLPNRPGMSGHEGHAGHVMSMPAPPADSSAIETNAEDAARTPGPGEHAGHGEGGDRYVWLKLDQLEAADTNEGTQASWKGSLSWGSSLNRLWLTSEGARQEGHEVQTQLFWSHAVSRWWDLTLGTRLDNGPGASRTWAAVGVKGLAPYWFETAATFYVSDEQQTALRLDADYELLLTNRLILQPEVELNFYGKDDPARLQGSGLSDVTVGLRLRYEIRRKFAPYLGVEWTRRHGQTEDLARATGERVHDSRAMAGLRIWY